MMALPYVFSGFYQATPLPKLELGQANLDSAACARHLSLQGLSDTFADSLRGLRIGLR